MQTKQQIDRLIEDLRKAGLSGKYGEPSNPRWVKIWVRDDFHCVYCNAYLLADRISLSSAQIDHILPKSKYPQFRDLPENTVLSCFCCNQIKRAFDPLSKCTDDIAKKLSQNNFRDYREELIDKCRKFVNAGLEGKDNILQRSLSAISRRY